MSAALWFASGYILGGITALLLLAMMFAKGVRR